MIPRDASSWTGSIRASTPSRWRRGGFAPFTLNKVKVVKEGFGEELLITLNQGGSISGVVLSHEGKPLDLVYVKLRQNNYRPNPLENYFGGAYAANRGTVKTDAEGRYMIKNIEPGTYQLELAHRYYPALRINDIQVEMDRESVLETQRMKKGAILRGKVYNKANSPMAGASVTLMKTDNSFQQRITTGPNGLYRFENLPPGKYYICAIPKIPKDRNPLSLIGPISSLQSGEPIELIEGETRELTLVALG